MITSRLFAVAIALLSGAVSVVSENSTTTTSVQSSNLNIPSCASNCFITAFADSSCDASDISCACSDTTLRQTLAHCAQKSCNISDLLTTLNDTAIACHEPIRDRGPAYNAITLAMGVTTAFFIVIRFAFKLFVTHETMYADDWIALFTFLAGIPGSVINVCGVGKNGMGRDVWTLSVYSIERFAYYFYVMEELYFFHMGLLKLALLFFLLRIFPAPNVHLMLLFTIAFTILYTAAFIITGLVQCSPMNFFWKRYTQATPGHCININAMSWSHAAIGIILDIWMLAVPLWQLRYLRLHWKKKVGVALMFFVGTFITVISIVRLQSLIHFASSQNPTWDQFDTGKWSTIEVNVGIICSCMPCMRLILLRFFPVIFGSSTSHGYINTGSAIPASYRAGVLSEPLGHHDDRSGNLNSQEASAIVMSQSYQVEVSENKGGMAMHELDFDGITKTSGSRSSDEP